MPDLLDTRICSEAQWPPLGVGLAVARIVRPRRPTRRPLVTRRSLSSRRLAQYSSGDAQGQGRAAIVPLLSSLPACVAHDFCNPGDPDALSDDSAFFAVTRQQWRACVRRMLRCKLACILSLSSLDPRLASGALAAVKDESVDRFIEDRRP